MKLTHLLLLPLCACALTACGGGGGGSGNGDSGGNGNNDPGFDASDWAAHPGAEVAAEQSTVDGEVLAGKTMTVKRTATGGESDTSLSYSFAPGKSGSYTRTTASGTMSYVISTYTYKAHGKTTATLTVDMNQESGIARHEYTLSFSSAKSAMGTLSIDGGEMLSGLTVEIK